MTTKRKTGDRTIDPLKEATTIALSRVIDPLLDLMLDAGVTVRELNQLIRERAVRNATRRVVRDTGRESRSRVAIATGLPRSEVAKILGSRDKLNPARRGQHPARRVLAAWYEDSRCLTPTGDPAVLPIFGRRRSFEHLVSIYGSGIPVRAMLDELTRIAAVEHLPNQKLLAKSRVPIITGLNSSAIAMVGERGADLLETMTNNVRRKSVPLFEATAVVSDADPAMIGVIQREINQQGSSFVSSVNSLLNRSRVKRSRASANSAVGCRLGVTVFYFQDQNSSAVVPSGSSVRRRINLRRTVDERETITMQKEPTVSKE